MEIVTEESEVININDRYDVALCCQVVSSYKRNWPGAAMPEPELLFLSFLLSGNDDDS